MQNKAQVINALVDSAYSGFKWLVILYTLFFAIFIALAAYASWLVWQTL